MRLKKTRFFTLLAVIFTALMLFAPCSVRAASVSFDDVPVDAVSYTLYWPDGSEETYSDRDAAIKESEAERLLGTFTSNEEGIIELTGYSDSGSVRLYESVVPEGYEADSLNTEADLSKGSVTIVNNKKTEPPAGVVNPGEKSNPDGTRRSTNGESKKAAASVKTVAPATGDKDLTHFWTGIAAAAASGAVAAVLIRRRKTGLLIIMISAGAIGMASLGATAYAQDTVETTRESFIINKTDGSGNPVEGAVFEVYAKPVRIKWTDAAKNIVVIYTNDVHCAVDTNIGYAGVSAYRKELEADPSNAVFLVDNGDALQGGIMGTLTHGDSIVNIMNAMEYDVAAPGNHEYDFGMNRFLELADKAKYQYISCNFTDLRTGEPVFEPYKILDAGNKKVAFIGVTTPYSLTSSTPAYFRDENGKFIYGFCEGNNGRELYNAVQNAVNAARGEGADYCILVSHLGIEAKNAPYMSTDVIANTSGIDAVLDGHSHSVIEMEKVKNKEGHDVILTQAGYQIPYIGKLTIDPAGNIKSELIGDYTIKDEAITAIIEAERDSYKDVLGAAEGRSEYKLVAKDESGWLVRNGETNLGDFLADAFRYATGSEIGFINGGSIRTNIEAGEITYADLLNVQPFSNYVVSKKVTGKELADALEFSVKDFPENSGGFLHVSGITYDVNPEIESSVKRNDSGEFISVEGARRVSNIRVNGEPLDENRIYSCGSIDYTLINNGDGYNMFSGDTIDLGRTLVDVDSIVEYLRHLGGVLPSEYSDPEGQGRINFIK